MEPIKVHVHTERDADGISSFRLEFPEPACSARITAFILRLRFGWNITGIERPDPLHEERSLICALEAGQRLDPHALSVILNNFSFTVSEPTRSALAA